MLFRSEVIALDGSWGTGPLNPTEEAWVRFDRPGEYVYHCKDHPWSYGEIIVSAKANSPAKLEGPYSRSDSFVAQASQGEKEFNKSCSACHGNDLMGRPPAPALIGNAFLLRWSNAQVGDLLDKMRTTMPQTAPGSLSQQSYLDILAYVLRVNRLTPSSETGGLRELKLRDMPRDRS